MKLRFSISCSSKVIAKVKVDKQLQTNRQTDRTKTICPDHSIRRQTDRQDKNNIPPIIGSGGIKTGQEQQTGR